MEQSSLTRKLFGADTFPNKGFVYSENREVEHYLLCISQKWFSYQAVDEWNYSRQKAK